MNTAPTPTVPSTPTPLDLSTLPPGTIVYQEPEVMSDMSVSDVLATDSAVIVIVDSDNIRRLVHLRGSAYVPCDPFDYGCACADDTLPVYATQREALLAAVTADYAAACDDSRRYGAMLAALQDSPASHATKED